jgi:predicted PurR-regulated permease PerM
MEVAGPQATGLKFLLTAACAIIIISWMRESQALILPFLIALFLAILCAPLIFWLQRHRVPAVVAVILVVVLLLGILTAFLAIVGGSVNEFTAAIPRYQQRIDTMARSAGAWLAAWTSELSWFPRQEVVSSVSSLELLDVISPGSMMGFLGRGLSGLFNTLSSTVLVILTLVFMLLEAVGLPTKMLVAFGSKEGDPNRFAGVTTEVQQYLLIKTGMSLATGVVIAIWLAILGLDFAIVWGLLAFLLNYIPTLGSIIASVPAILLALVQLGPTRALAVTIGFLVVNLVFGNIVEPHLMGRRLGLSTLVVFLSLVFWGWVLGPVGMLLSVPLTMIVKILLENSSDLKWVAVMLDSNRSAADELKQIEARPRHESVAAGSRAGEREAEEQQTDK